jgi:hypothetical protein
VDLSRLPPALRKVLERSQEVFQATPVLLQRYSTQAVHGVSAGPGGGGGRARGQQHDEL